MTRRRHNVKEAKARRSRRLVAIARSELEQRDAYVRVAPASPTSACVKDMDAATRALVDEAIKLRGGPGDGEQ